MKWMNACCAMNRLLQMKTEYIYFKLPAVRAVMVKGYDCSLPRQAASLPGHSLCMTLVGGSAWHQHRCMRTATLGEGVTSDNEEPGEPGRQVLLHLIMEVAREGSLQLGDGGNQEGYPQDSNSAADLTHAFILNDAKMQVQYSEACYKQAYTRANAGGFKSCNHVQLDCIQS